MEYLLICCFLLAIFSSLIPTGFSSTYHGTEDGFSIELIHSNTPLSPFYDQSAIAGERARSAAYHSMARVNNSASNGNSIQSTALLTGSWYLMKFFIGTPRMERFAIMDTGSDLLWVQCAPCERCYHQDSQLFDPKTSTTYHGLSCGSASCRDMHYSHCDLSRGKCQYSYPYAGGWSSSGVLATDTLGFDTADNKVTAFFTDFVFGCGSDNQGSFTSHGTGVVGLGGGAFSLISQLGSRIERKFSYCLLPRTASISSKLTFGRSGANVSGYDRAVSTALFSDDLHPTYYYLRLEEITVGGKKITSKKTTDQGNIIIDSGTASTFLVTEIYNQVEEAMKEMIGLEQVQDPQRRFRLCYETHSFNKVPAELALSIHFTGPADIILKKINLFTEVDHDITCFAMMPSSDGVQIYGNMAQVDFLVEYNLKSKHVLFAPADCTQYSQRSGGAGGGGHGHNICCCNIQEK